MKKLTIKEFSDKSNIVHNHKYDYSLVEYIKNCVNIKIICLEHGEFEQTPNNHLAGTNCPKCGSDSRIKNKTSNTKEFIYKASLIHSNKYDYSLVKYINDVSKVIIICPIHKEFKQRPNDHKKGSGCHKCATELLNDRNRKTTKEFVTKAKLIHDNVYDYSLSNYVKAINKIKIICSHHGVFEQIGSNHLSGSICPKCNIENSSVWSLTEWKIKMLFNNITTPMLYVLKCYKDNEEFIKVGITMHNIKTRYNDKNKMPYEFIVLLEIKNTPEQVFKIEKITNKTFRLAKYLPKIKFSGMTECFNIENEKEIINFLTENLK